MFLGFKACFDGLFAGPVDVRPAKIVAGLEAVNTNLLLQALAGAASDPSVDSAAAVRRTLSGEKPGDGPAAKKLGGIGRYFFTTFSSLM